MQPRQQGQCARHPERIAETVCPRCGNFTCTECNPDGHSLCPACVQLGGTAPVTHTPTPWERRAELGFVQGLFQTWKKSLFEPSTFWRSVPPDGSQFDAGLYAWLLTVATALLQIPLTWLNFAQMKDSFATLGNSLEQFKSATELFDKFGSAPLFAIGVAVATIVMFPIGLIVSAGLTYLGGMMFGASDRGFGATLRAVAYAQSASVFAVIPFVGGFAGFWVLASEIMAIKDMQASTGWKAAGAVLWWVVLALCCGGVLAAVIGVAAVSKLSH